MMKIAVTGPRGRLGSELVAHYDCVPIEADITDFDALKNEIERINPHVIIHTAAYNDVDGAEKEYHRAVRVNVTGSGNVRIAFRGYLIALSTSYVFDGKSKRRYREEDEPHPIGAYGWSKFGCETALETIMTDRPTLIVRTISPFGKGQDFCSRILDKFSSGESVEVPTYLYSNPIYITHLAEALVHLPRWTVTGKLNIAGLTRVSRYEWACHLAFAFGLDKHKVGPLNKVPDHDYRPLEATLDLKKASRIRGLRLYTLAEGLEAYKRAQAS